jgi:uncharacterized protein YheU (UPF0270 family)
MPGKSIMMVVPYSMLSESALNNLVEEYVTRDGTDNTDSFIKKDEIIKQLKSGNLVIVYDEDTNSSNIVESDLVLPNE